MPSLRIGTRGSPLALWQANFVADSLLSQVPNLQVELVQIETVGDQVRDVPLAVIGGEGVFTKAIQDALLAETVDVAVHSLKDLPTIPIAGLTLAAVPPRGPVGDAFISRRHSSFESLPTGAVVATSSLRRRAQLLNRRPDLKLVDMRGNVETRLRKLAEHDLDAIILAEAGLKRLGLEKEIGAILDRRWMFPAVGQGALGLECRTSDSNALHVLQALDDPVTHQAVIAERSMLWSLGGGCQVPVGAVTESSGDVLTLRGAVLSPNGARRIEAAIQDDLANAHDAGRKLAEQLIRLGAKELLGT